MSAALVAILLMFGNAPPAVAAVHPHRAADGIRVYRAFAPPHLGIGVTEMTPELRRFFGAPADFGVLVSRVEEGSAAERARLRVGDVIIKVGDEDVDDAEDVRRSLSGGEVVVVLIRKKKKVKKKVELDTEPHGGEGSRDLEEALRRTRDQIRKIEQRLEKLERSRPKGRSKAKSKAGSKTQAESG